MLIKEVLVKKTKALVIIRLFKILPFASTFFSAGAAAVDGAGPPAGAAPASGADPTNPHIADEAPDVDIDQSLCKQT